MIVEEYPQVVLMADLMREALQAEGMWDANINAPPVAAEGSGSPPDPNARGWRKGNFVGVAAAATSARGYTDNDIVNEVQLQVLANADHFISVQGGPSVLCSLFKVRTRSHAKLWPCRNAHAICGCRE